MTTPARPPAIRTRRRALAALALLAGGCAHASLVARPGPADPAPLALAWSSPVDRGHRFVGRILDTAGRRWVDAAALEAAVAAADLVVLGEAHDNADHHRLQARLIAAAAATDATAGRPPPAVAFEMVEASQQPTLDAAQAAPSATADSIGAALEWSASGWPDFALYRPIFAAALDAHLPLHAANLPRQTMRDIMRRGGEAVPADPGAWLARAGAPPASETAGLREEMERAHCGQMPAAMVAPMVLAQRARDAQLALRLTQAAADRPAILIAGAGHARTDRGVPAYLRREAPSRRAVSVGLIEVERGRDRVEDYASTYGTTLPPFDFAVFTPAADREDPCARLKKTLHHAAPAAAK